MPLTEFRDKYPNLIARLWQARSRDRVGHAYIITGDHTGAIDRFALGWMQMALCGQPKGDDACGSCDSCARLANGTYPYQQTIKPKSKSRRILIEQIRELEHYLHLKSDGQIKIGIIHDADRMNEAAQNAFLKTLEEPSPRTLLLLLTLNPMDLLPTVRSRCQLLAILENQTLYDFSGSSELIAALSKLSQGKGAAAAIEVTTHITETLQHLRKESESEAKKQQKTLAGQTADLERAVQKRLDDEFQAHAASLYLSRRDSLLSAVHTWFAQEYLRANNVEDSILPNAELYQCLGTDTRPEVTTTAARRSLELTESFMESLRYNVDEPLAIEDFCLKVCARR